MGIDFAHYGLKVGIIFMELWGHTSHLEVHTCIFSPPKTRLFSLTRSSRYILPVNKVSPENQWNVKMLNKDVHLELQLYQVLPTDSKTNIEMTIEITFKTIIFGLPNPLCKRPVDPG